MKKLFLFVFTLLFCSMSSCTRCSNNSENYNKQDGNHVCYICTVDYTILTVSGEYVTSTEMYEVELDPSVRGERVSLEFIYNDGQNKLFITTGSYYCATKSRVKICDTNMPIVSYGLKAKVKGIQYDEK